MEKSTGIAVAIVIVVAVAVAVAFVVGRGSANTPQSASVSQTTAAAPTGNTSVTLPVTVLPTSDSTNGQGMYADKYPVSVGVENAAGFANEVAAYGASYSVWIAPQGWTGEGVVGTDGNVVVNLYPPGGSATSGQRISYYEVPACQFCMLSDAAQYFGSAMQSYNSEYNTNESQPITVPQGMEVTPISSTLVIYTLPNENGLSVRGVAYYDPANQLNGIPFVTAEFVLPTSDASLSNFLSQTLINQEGLQ